MLATGAASSDWPGSLSRPAIRALVRAGYTRLEDLRGLLNDELSTLHGVGSKALELLRAALTQSSPSARLNDSTLCQPSSSGSRGSLIPASLTNSPSALKTISSYSMVVVMRPS